MPKSDWPIVTAQIETSMYEGTSAWPVVLGCATAEDPDAHKLGYLSGACREPDSSAWRGRNPGKRPMTRLWLQLDPEELAKLPGVRDAVLAAGSKANQQPEEGAA